MGLVDQEGMNENIADRIKGLDIPAHVICSREDPVIAIDAIYNEVLPYLKHPSVITLSKVGHLMPMEAPRKIARQIRNIMRS